MTDFSAPLLSWYDQHKRDMPWRESKDPYFIWVSEVMLQQTQVTTVIPYFDRFIHAFPSVRHLARADSQQVMKLWEGLGYYSRARNLHKASIIVDNDYDGKLPDNYQALQQLPGLGPYTAAAVASIAFGQPVPSVDGNVLRVMARINEDRADSRKPAFRNNVFLQLRNIISTERPGDFNQALMEIGATVCKPKTPACQSCPLSFTCGAFKNQTINLYPFKTKLKPRPHKIIAIGIVIRQGQILIARRRENQMLGGLWEYPGGKVEEGETIQDCVIREYREEVNLNIQIKSYLCQFDHEFTHFSITIHAYLCEIISGEARALSADEIKWISPEKLDQYPFPKANKVINKHLIQWLKAQ